jgi:hypothetical protein
MTRTSKLRDWARGLVESLGRIVLGEPARIVPERTIRRLGELERREELQSAEARGDVTYLRAELSKVQLSEADLHRLAAKGTPIQTWPDEDFNGLIAETPDTASPY